MAAFGNTGANAPGSVFAELIGGTFQPRDHLCNGPCSYSLSEPLAAAGVADARAKAVVPSYGRLIFANGRGFSSWASSQTSLSRLSWTEMAGCVNARTISGSS